MKTTTDYLLNGKPRVLRILGYLLDVTESVSTVQLAGEFGLNPRTIRYDLEELDRVCSALPVKLVRSRRGVRLEGPASSKSELKSALLNQKFLGSARNKERRFLRLLWLLLNTDTPVVVKQLQDLLGVGSRTIYADLDEAEIWLDAIGLQLIRKPHFGFKVEGSEFLRRYACFQLLVRHLPTNAVTTSASSAFIDTILGVCESVFKQSFLASELAQGIASIVETLASELPEKVRRETILYLLVACRRMTDGYWVSFTKANVKRLQGTREYRIAEQITQSVAEKLSLSVPDDETAYIALHFLGVFTSALTEPTAHGTLTSSESLDDEQFVSMLVQDMITAVDTALGVQLGQDTELIQGLRLHVKPMVYRILYGIPIQNELLDEIQTNHPLAYYAAILASQVFETRVGKSTSRAEIGYLALHFGAALQRRQHQVTREDNAPRVLVVCAGGVGMGKILTSRIQTEFPYLQIVETVGTTRVDLAVRSNDVDAIVSTVPLHDVQLPHIVVKPLLLKDDIERIVRWLDETGIGRSNGSPRLRVQKDIESAIHAQFDVLHQDMLRAEIEQFLDRIEPYVAYRTTGSDRPRGHQMQTYTHSGKWGPPMLKLLTEQHIQAKITAHNPDDVIETCGYPLVQSGAVEPRYVEAMKKSLRENGPYMVIVPGVSILHARPEDGVKEVCISMATLAEPVPFGHKDNDPVRLAIAFGAVDQHRHIEALSDLMRLLSNTAALDEICKADNPTQILQILQRVLA